MHKLPAGQSTYMIVPPESYTVFGGSNTWRAASAKWFHTNNEPTAFTGWTLGKSRELKLRYDILDIHDFVALAVASMYRNTRSISFSCTGLGSTKRPSPSKSAASSES